MKQGLTDNMQIELSNESNYTCHEAQLIEVAIFAMEKMGLHPDCDLSILIVDEERMTQLHIQWMDLPGATDVLSFPMDEIRPFSAAQGAGTIGDIVLCPQFAEHNANSRSIDDELALLMVHGVLHLIGFDHATEMDEKEMFALQEELLAQYKGVTI